MKFNEENEMVDAKMAYDLVYVDKNNDKHTISIDTVDSLGLDYSQDLKDASCEEELDIDYHYISLMQDIRFAYKVYKALLNKGIVNKDDIKNRRLYIMVWQYFKDGSHVEYAYADSIPLIELDKWFE